MCKYYVICNNNPFSSFRVVTCDRRTQTDIVKIKYTFYKFTANTPTGYLLSMHFLFTVNTLNLYFKKVCEPVLVSRK